MSHDFQSLVPSVHSILSVSMAYTGAIPWTSVLYVTGVNGEGRNGPGWKSGGWVNPGLFSHLLLLSSLSIFICKMERLAHMGWPRQHVPDQNILSWPLRPQRWDRARDRPWKAMVPRPGGAWSGWRWGQRVAELAQCPPPQLFLP